MTTNEDDAGNPESIPIAPAEDSEPTLGPPDETFVPPEGATKARYRRLNLDTGGWEDAQVLYEGIRTCSVDADAATPNVEFAQPVQTPHRITWYSGTGRILGYSKNWRPHTDADLPGGESNTPRKWPAVNPRAPAVVQPSGYLTPQDSLSYMRGLAELTQQAAGPVVAMIATFSEQLLQRERNFFREQIALMETRHAHNLQTDRQFLETVREVEQAPRDRKVQELQAQLAALESDAQERAEADAEAEANAPEEGDPSGMKLASAVVENAPAIIREVANQARAFKAGTPVALPNPDE